MDIVGELFYEGRLGREQKLEGDAWSSEIALLFFKMSGINV